MPDSCKCGAGFSSLVLESHCSQFPEGPSAPINFLSVGKRAGENGEGGSILPVLRLTGLLP